ncbi:hypothetical protein VINI7043_16668 [Vibrio nigripulchritudo ATCC 27043]|nr:hypothetical protein VINI7043_16668 [Vibrio nigripulchritudo ATCC 27043]
MIGEERGVIEMPFAFISKIEQERSIGADKQDLGQVKSPFVRR